MLDSLEKVFKAVLLPKYPFIKDIVLESQKEDEVNYISCILIVDPENELHDIGNEVSRNVYSLAKAMGLPIYGKEAWVMYSVFWRSLK
jgi:hypothetical protein